MKAYLLVIDYPYFIAVAGITVFVILTIFFKKALRNDDDDILKSIYIPIIAVVAIGFIASFLERISDSKNEKLISNVWNVLIEQKKVPDLEVISISDDYSASRFKLTLVNDDVYFVPYEVICYNKLSVSLVAYKKENVK